MKKLILILLILFLSTLFAVESNIDTISKRGVINIGLTRYDNFPFYYTDTNGILTGRDIDICKKLADLLRVEVVFNRESTSLIELYNKLESREVDIIISGLKKNYYGASQVLYSESYTEIRDVIVIKRINSSVLTDKKVDFLHDLSIEKPDVGVLEANNNNNLKQLLPFSKIVKFKDNDILISSLLENKFEVVFTNEIDINEIIDKEPSLLMYLKIITLNSNSSYYMAVNSEDSHFLQWINLFIENDVEKQ